MTPRVCPRCRMRFTPKLRAYNQVYCNKRCKAAARLDRVVVAVLHVKGRPANRYFARDSWGDYVAFEAADIRLWAAR